MMDRKEEYKREIKRIKECSGESIQAENQAAIQRLEIRLVECMYVDYCIKHKNKFLNFIENERKTQRESEFIAKNGKKA